MVDATPLRKASSPPFTTIERAFADGDYIFGLGWQQMLELEEARNTPLLPLLTRLANGLWHVKDAPAVIRLGLIGGGTEPVKALRLVHDYIETRPPGEGWPLAVEILNLALFGPSPVEAGANAPPASSEPLRGNGSETASGANAPPESEAKS